ncbi:hemophore-related protein [Mycolicibacterium mucogenicum]|uniref:hemophore-related protein n=1 Tax=Mycolicibacterium mucogenicum TaxID=56689 RepID=UPI000B114901|nr:hemophore-related protein [Mycolicibacterium mucogenicum]
MTRAVTFGRSTLGFIALGAACAALVVPRASADPVSPTSPTTSATASPTTTATTAATPTTSATAPSTTTTTTVAPAATVADCSTATLAKTISSVTLQLSDYFAAHPDADAALLDATRQSAFAAMSQFDNYFKAHPDEADALRGIQAPLAAFKDRCGLQVAPTDALAVLNGV